MMSLSCPINGDHLSKPPHAHPHGNVLTLYKARGDLIHIWATLNDVGLVSMHYGKTAGAVQVRGGYFSSTAPLRCPARMADAEGTRKGRTCLFQVVNPDGILKKMNAVVPDGNATGSHNPDIRGGPIRE